MKNVKEFYGFEQYNLGVKTEIIALTHRIEKLHLWHHALRLHLLWTKMP